MCILCLKLFLTSNMKEEENIEKKTLILDKFYFLLEKHFNREPK